MADVVNNEQAQQVENPNLRPELQLDDGTGTGVSIDTATQGEAVKEYGDAEIVFDKGNLKTMLASGQVYNNKLITIKSTILPLIEKALIELFQYSTAYYRTLCNVTPVISDEAGIKFNIDANYYAEGWIDSDADDNDVQHDESYIRNTLTVVPGLTIKSIDIDTTKGTLIVSLSF